jgi:adenylate cyclase
MRGRHLEPLIALVLAGLWGFGVYFAHSHGHLRFLDRVESTMIEFRTLVRGPRVPPDVVTIVAIDDALVKQGGSYPVARADLARIVDAIAKSGPKVIAVDLLLVDRGPDDGDEALAKSLAGRPTAIAAAAVFPEASQSIAAENDGPLARLPRAEKFLLPLKRFADHAEIGIVNVATDRSGIPRSMLFRTSDRVEMSFPLGVAALAIGKEPTIEPNRLVLGERFVPYRRRSCSPDLILWPAPQHPNGQRGFGARRRDRTGHHPESNCHRRSDRHRRRRFIPDAVRSGVAGRRGHRDGDHAPDGRRRHNCGINLCASPTA